MVGRRKADFPEVPDHLLYLFQRSCGSFTEEQYKRKTLLKNQDNLARNKIGVDTCSVIKHTVVTVYCGLFNKL